MAKAKPARTARSAATGRRATGSSSIGAELNALFDRTASGSRTLADALEQAQSAQGALQLAQERLADLEAQQSAEIERLESELTSERDEAVERARSLQAAATTAQRDFKAAVKQLGSLAGLLVKAPDPLDPLSEDDHDRELRELREQLDELVDRRGTTPGDLAGMGAALEAANELVDHLIGRIKLQSGRVKLLQEHLSELESDNEQLQSEADLLRSTNDQAEATIDQALADMDQVSLQITTLHEALEHADATIAERDSQAAEAAARSVTQSAELEEQIEAGQARAEELEKMLREAKDLAHKAEHAGAELAEVIVHLCDGDLAQGEVCPMPGLNARDELASLASDAGEDWADEVDELFRQDLGEDMVVAAKTVSESLLKRRQAIVEALEHERQRAHELEQRCTDQAAQVADLTARLSTTEQELSRTKAELETTVNELESTASELGEKHKELTETKGVLAKANAELETLRDQAALAKTLKSELTHTKSDLGKISRQVTAADTLRAEASKSQNALAKALVDLATATDAALTAGNLKAGGHVSRFTKSFKQLDNVVQHSDGDLLRLIRSSSDVVDKVTNRIEHIGAELRERGHSINQSQQRLVQLEQLNSKATLSLDEQEAALKELKIQTQELGRASKQAAKLEERLAKKEAALAEATESLKALKEEQRLTLAELEELRAREEELSESSDREVAELKRRLSDELNARRSTESDLHDEREQLQAQVSTLEARFAELESSLDDRDAQIAELQSELDEAGDLKALLREAQSTVKALSKDLDDERARSRQLQDDLAEQAEAETLAAELKDLAADRDALMAKLRQAEKRLADDAGTIASLKTTNESMSRKLETRSSKYREDLESLQARCDALLEENRRFKEKNAGLNARVRSLTNY